jgi:hypothetical protein
VVDEMEALQRVIIQGDNETLVIKVPVNTQELPKVTEVEHSA